MSRERKDNASYWKGATKGKPGKALTTWQKRPYFHRALIRNAFFWPVVILLGLLTVNRTAALMALTVVSIPAFYIGFRRIRLTFFMPFNSTEAVSGAISQHWIMRPKWRKILHRQPIPGLVAKKDRISLEFPAEMEETVLKAIAADEDGQGGMPALKVKPYRRR